MANSALCLLAVFAALGLMAYDTRHPATPQQQEPGIVELLQWQIDRELFRLRNEKAECDLKPGIQAD